MPDPAALSPSATATTALAGVVHGGRHGAASGMPGVKIAEMHGIGLARITARKGMRAALIEAAQAAYAVELPTTPRRVETRDISFMWDGPDQWLAQTPLTPATSMETLLAPELVKLAAIVDQSHACTFLRVSGPRARDALAKGLAIDLHPRAFAPLHVARTSIAHIGVQICQLDDLPTYEFLIPRSYSHSFWHWLQSSAAEYGLEVAPPISPT